MTVTSSFRATTRRTFLQALLVTCLLAANALAAPGDSAGIVLYHIDGDRVFLLLADHDGKNRGWAGFGGGRDKGETPAETAARETEEETRGYVKRADLLAKIKDQKPVFDGDFALFFVEIDPVPTAAIASHPLPPGSGETYRERGPWAWVPFSAIQPHLTEPSSRSAAKIDPALFPAGAAKHFWPVWLRNLSVALKEGRLPWMSGE